MSSITLTWRPSPCTYPIPISPYIDFIETDTQEVPYQVIFDTFEAPDRLRIYDDDDNIFLDTGLILGSNLQSAPNCDSPGSSANTYVFTKPTGVPKLNIRLDGPSGDGFNVTGLYLCVAPSGSACPSVQNISVTPTPSITTSATSITPTPSVTQSITPTLTASNTATVTPSSSYGSCSDNTEDNKCGCSEYDCTMFFNVDSYGKYYKLTQLEDNIRSFLDWSFLNIGAFTNIHRVQTESMSGGNMYTLRPSDTSNKIWETPRKEWVWEDNICYNNYAPINISGIYINNNFYPGPSGEGNYSYKLNYKLGSVIFNQSLQSTDIVELSYSFKNVQIYKSNECSWFHELQQYSYDPTKYTHASDLLSNQRVQMPCIILEFLPRTILKPYEIGSNKNIIYQDIMMHILTENYIERSTIIDILLNQKDRPLKLYDLNKVVKNKKYIFNYDGTLNTDRLNYKQCVENPEFFLDMVYIRNIDLIDFYSFNKIHICNMRLGIEIIP